MQSRQLCPFYGFYVGHSGSKCQVIPTFVDRRYCKPSYNISSAYPKGESYRKGPEGAFKGHRIQAYTSAPSFEIGCLTLGVDVFRILGLG